MDKLVCDKCPLILHKKSTLCNIERVYEEKLADIMNFKDKIDNEISFYSEKRKYLKKTKSDGYENIDKTKQEIVKREQLLCELATTQTQAMTIDLEDELKKKLGTITKLKEKAQKRRQKIGKSIMQIDTVLQSNKATTLFYALREIGGKSYSPVKINTTDLVKAFRNYCFKCLSKLNVLKLFGITREIKSMETSSIFNLGILRIYTKNHKIITKCVHSEKDDTLWICNDGESVVRKTKLNDNKIKTIGELRGVCVSGMTVTIDGELLVSQWNDSKIMCISHDTCRTLIELPFGDIVGIHASRHNDIFIGMVVELEIQPLNAISDSTECFILIFGFDGTYKRSYEFNEENIDLEILPTNITTNVNGDICVIDFRMGYTRRIVILTKDGQVKSIYSGHKELNSRSPFYPTDVATDLNGYIFVADMHSHAIHILSIQGDFLAYKLTSKFDILNPCSLHFDTKGRLIIAGQCKHFEYENIIYSEKDEDKNLKTTSAICIVNIDRSLACEDSDSRVEQ